MVVSMIDRNAFKGAMAVSATLADLRGKEVDVNISAVLLNSVDPHRTTYQLLREALLGAQLPLMATEVPMRADFQNAVTAGVPLVSAARRRTRARRRSAWLRAS